MTMSDRIFTAKGSPNIALIKYWGKRDEKLILPYNSSLSLTLSSDSVSTTTSILFSKRLKDDVLYIDGKKLDIRDEDIQERLWVLEKMREEAGVNANFLVVSRNNFPPSSGMASSASGIATLVFAANEALGLGMSPKELSMIARQGSGSACRSIFGGLVKWHKGERKDGSDSYAEQVFDEKYWPEIIDMVAITSSEKKKVPSRAGMRQTVETNPLFKSRVASAEKRVSDAIAAYGKRDFNELAEITMADSNEMHALMMGTRPSIRYLNDASYSIMNIIEELNREAGTNIAAYTFDAGPNAHIITQEEFKEEITAALKGLRKEGRIAEMRVAGQGSGPVEVKGESLIDPKKMAPK